MTVKEFLNMSEEEQINALYSYGYENVADLSGPDPVCVDCDKNNNFKRVYHKRGTPLEFNRLALADLAFRLRDEVKEKTRYRYALISIYRQMHSDITHTFEEWLMRLKPIDMIAAALDAKGVLE